METCEELRNMTSDNASGYGPPGKYSFIHKVIDGITINVNTVNISFKSPAFVASLQVAVMLILFSYFGNVRYV